MSTPTQPVEAHPVAAGSGSSTRSSTVARVGLALVLLSLALIGPVVARQDASSWSRTALTASWWEDHSVDVTGYPLGIDRVEYDGELRSDKAPGQPLVAVPFYAVYRAFGGENAAVVRVHENLNVWWQTLWTSVVPFAALVVLMFLAARAVAPRFAVLIAVALGFGTLLFPYSDHLYGHSLSALAIFGVWLLVRDGPLTPTRVASAGLLGAFAAAVEYQVALIAFIIGIAILLRSRRALAWYVLGALPVVAAVGLYHWVAVGSPFRVPYSLKSVHEGGLVGIGLPGGHYLVEIFVGDRGLFVITPIVVVALVAAVMVASAPGPWRRDAVVGLASFGALLWVQSGGSMPPYGGSSAGPRYLIPAIPFLAVPLAAVWERLRPLAPLAAVWSIAVMLLPTFTQPLIADNASAVPTWLRLFRDGEITPTVFSMGLGTFGILVHVALVVAAMVFLVRSTRADIDSTIARS